MTPPTYTEHPMEQQQQTTPVYVPRIGAFEAFLRHWPLVLLPVVFMVAAALALGLQRDPVYEAETRMTVAGIDVTQPGGLSGLAIAGPTLASTYSRSVDAEGVIEPVADKLGMNPEQVRRRVSATPVPDSPIFRVRATAAEGERAIRLANATAEAITDYVALLARPTDSTSALFEDYRRAANEYYNALERRRAAESRFGSTELDSDRARMIAARAEANAAELRLDGVRESYIRSISARTTAPGAQQLSKATGSTSDKNAKLQIYLFAGAVAGLLAGIALASLRANRLLRRRLTSA
jgi:capsular polysaccharide biosynthesis protein